MVAENRTGYRQAETYEPALQALIARLHGEVVRPGDPDFDAARSVWDGGSDRYPALVVRAADTGDVVEAVSFAREHGLTVAVRSGGHSFAGYGTIDDGMIVDLSHMRSIDIDPETEIATVEPGLTWGEVAEKAQEYGLALTSGDMASVGVGGLTLGGGIGWMARKYGLTIDNLRAVELVTADGRVLTASPTENPDLFWGLRGGGGNFGIATSFEFQMRPAGLIVGGAVIYEAASSREILARYARYAAEAPDELTTMALYMQAPPAPFIPADKVGTPALVIAVCYVGDLEEGQRVVAPLRTLGTPIADIVGPMPYPALFALTAAGTVRGLHHHDRSTYLSSIDDGMLDILAAEGETLSPASMLQLRILGGAMSRVAEDATAFAHRDKPAMFTVIGMWPDPAQAEPVSAWVDRVYRRFQPYASGVYVNFLAREGEDRIREAYKPAIYERLVALKNRYDPTNFFSQNQNIKPTRQASEADEELAA